MSVSEEKTDMRLAEELDAALMVLHNLKRENAQLKSENEMLREALERITKASMPHEEPVSRMIAREALEAK